MRHSFFVLLLFLPAICFAQHDSLRLKIQAAEKLSKGSVEVALKDIETGDTFSFHGTLHAPMQSVFKFPIALTVLDHVDKGLLNLKQEIPVSKNDLDTNMWSPMSKKYIGKGTTSIPLKELLYYMVCQSDGVACDMLIKLCGGADTINKHIHQLGIQGIVIKYSEAEMHNTWNAQYADWSEAIEMRHLIELFYLKKCLSEASTAYLMDLMIHCETGTNRIRALLPPGTIVADKTGTSGTRKGLSPATNDVGIITLPNGNHLAIVVFVTNSKAPQKTREGTIAAIAKMAYDEFSKK